MDMILDFCAACGYTREEVLGATMLPWTEALTDWGWRVVTQRPWQVALTALTIGLESQPPEIYPPSGGEFPQTLWLVTRPRSALFAGHIEADTVHGARGFKMAEKYCDTRQSYKRQQLPRWRQPPTSAGSMNGLYWYTLYGRTDDTPAEEA